MSSWQIEAEKDPNREGQRKGEIPSAAITGRQRRNEASCRAGGRSGRRGWLAAAAPAGARPARRARPDPGSRPEASRRWSALPQGEGEVGDLGPLGAVRRDRRRDRVGGDGRRDEPGIDECIHSTSEGDCDGFSPRACSGRSLEPPSRAGAHGPSVETSERPPVPAAVHRMKGYASVRRRRVRHGRERSGAGGHAASHLAQHERQAGRAGQRTPSPVPLHGGRDPGKPSAAHRLGLAACGAPTRTRAAPPLAVRGGGVLRHPEWMRPVLTSPGRTLATRVVATRTALHVIPAGRLQGNGRLPKRESIRPQRGSIRPQRGCRTADSGGRLAATG